jgi:lipopolysaccharide/colanic/teichoic acid biosynthesis glycosyltransferase
MVETAPRAAPVEPASPAARPEPGPHLGVRHPHLKRGFDLVCATLGIIALAPAYVLIAAAIKWTSPGPVFYRGLRAGRFNTTFRIFKFRTMVVDAERLGGPTTAKNDSRVTRVGRFLRRRKLDELPQLFNVLVGDMSIVGPRPEVPEVTAGYTSEEQLILTVRPGITDLASLEFVQLDEVVGEHDPYAVYREKVLPVKNALRLKYVREQSFLGDVRLILATLVRLVRRRPALAAPAAPDGAPKETA